MKRREMIQMAKMDSSGPDHVVCPECNAFLTDNVQKAYYYVGGREQWRCRACKATPWAKKEKVDDYAE